jgi:hypothetical protein
MNNWSVLLTVFLFSSSVFVQAQPTLEKDYSYVMEIPSVITMDSSPAHLYTLSDSEGMAVFRTHSDTLQWLYSSTGMEQRGHTMTADIRFAYLFGNGRRLTVLEPTSVLGVYSSTLLPSNPRDAKRIEQNLYVALGDKGLGKISLRTPASVDSTMDFVERSRLSQEKIIDLETSSDQLFALAEGQKLFRFNYADQTLSLSEEFDLSERINAIYLINKTLYGSVEDGSIYEIDSSGNLSTLGTIGESVKKMESWNDWIIIKGNTDRLWISYKNRSPELWKKNRDAGNYFTITKGNLWLCEYNKISRIVISSQETATATSNANEQGGLSGTLSLKEIQNQTIPHTQTLLLPITVNGDIPANTVQFTYQSTSIGNAEIRGQSFYWEPSSNDVGTHRVKIIASTNSGQTDSTSFNIEVKSFNAPPRFAPIRPISIPVGEEFSLPFKATDPDGMDSNLVRILGVNMPDGASINETTGEFSWTPTARQVGENKFRVIATDQYGAANSVNVTINVVENVRSEDSGN